MYPALHEVIPGSSLREIVASNTPGHTANNPSITKSPNGGYRFTVRSSNFVLDPSGLSHQTVEPNGIIVTKNYIGDMNDSLAITDMREVDYSQIDERIQYPWVIGMEDCRIFWDGLNGLWKMSGSHRQHRPDGVPTIAVDTLSGRSNVVESREILYGDDPNEFQKNWMPVGWANGFFRGPWGTEVQLRGSSQVVTLDGHGIGPILGVLHFVTWPGRFYWHLIGAFNQSGELIGHSDPFYFKDAGVEFANGAALWQDKLVVTFGYREARAFMALIPLDEALGSLHAVTL